VKATLKLAPKPIVLTLKTPQLPPEPPFRPPGSEDAAWIILVGRVVREGGHKKGKKSSGLKERRQEYNLENKEREKERKDIILA